MSAWVPSVVVTTIVAGGDVSAVAGTETSTTEAKSPPSATSAQPRRRFLRIIAFVLPAGLVRAFAPALTADTLPDFSPEYQTLRQLPRFAPPLASPPMSTAILLRHG